MPTTFVKAVSIIENGIQARNRSVSLPYSELVVELLNLLCRVGVAAGWRKESSTKLSLFLRFLPSTHRPLLRLRSTGSRSIFLDATAVRSNPSSYLILSTSVGLKTSYEASLLGVGGLLLIELNLI
jgi:ribosomal protein S8